MLETTDKSRELAASAWQKPETSRVQMDVVLAQAFAEILDQQGHEIVALKLKLAASEKARLDLEKRLNTAIGTDQEPIL